LKSNVGHTQAAAGAVGVIKVVQAIRHGVMPQTLHAEEPSPHIDWSAGEVKLLTKPQAWPDSGRPRRAAVSSFGVSGTNAHVIIEQAPEPVAAQDDTAVERAGAEAAAVERAGTRVVAVERAGNEVADGSVGTSLVPLVVSAKSPDALRAQAQRLAEWLARSELDGAAAPDLRDVGWSLATTRAQLEHRAVVLAQGRESALAGLTALAAGASTAEVVTGSPTQGLLAILFTGQGAQRIGMGRQLYDTFPVYAQAFDAVAAELDLHLERPLRQVMFAEPGSGEAALLDQTGFTQPALFAVEVALYQLLVSWGMRPDYLAGHSIGELAAAHVAGVFSLADAARLVAARGRLMQRMPAGGAMIAIQAGEAEVLPLLAGREGTVALAAVNGPSSVVLSGVEADVLAVVEELAARGRRTRRLTVSHAFHSPLMDPMLDEFRQVAGTVTCHPAAIPIVSTLTGAVVTAQELADPGYWARQVRQPVRFHDAVYALHGLAVSTFLEVGPAGVLTTMAPEAVPTGAAGLAFAPALRHDRPEPATLLTAAAQLHVRGHDLDWTALLAGGQRIDLPTYAFQRRRYWLEAPTSTRGSSSVASEIDAVAAAGEEPETVDGAPGDGAELAARLAGLDDTEQEEVLLEVIRAEAAAVLGHDDSEAIEVEAGFFDVGFSSLTAVELRNRLAGVTGLQLSAMLLFDHPSPALLAEHLRTLLAKAAA
jgi:acyl transferase domain-containing protein